jgi:hypothetical protein
VDEMQVGEGEAKVEAVELLKLLQEMVLLVMMGLQLKRDGEDQELLWLLVKVLYLREVGPGDEAEESSSIDTFIMSHVGCSFRVCELFTVVRQRVL